MQNMYAKYQSSLDSILRPAASFDIIRRVMKFSSGREATFYYIDGFTKDVIMQKLMEYFLDAKPDDILVNTPYVEVDLTRNVDEAVRMVLSGAAAMAVDGYDDILIIDTREYPTRSIDEPENDRVLRGPRDGFCETLIFNTALIRRRVRDPNLTMSIYSVGDLTQTDVVLCYIKGRADAKFVSAMESKLKSLKIGALNMTAESLAELLTPRQRWNPFPKIRYTERPDAAAAMLFEGSVLVICDNTPSVMLLPVSIFDFVQESDDFYFPPFIGTYLRLLRQFVFIVTIFLSPVWYLLVSNPDWLPAGLSFLTVATENYAVPLILQLLLVEFTIDGLKLASLNTPSSLAGSLSVVSGLILGEFAVEIGWLVPEVILYVAFVSIANFTQPSYELAYAFKFSRILMLIGIWAAGIWGFAAAVLIMLFCIAVNKGVDGSRSYLYPLIPFNARALKRLMFRSPLK